MLSASTDKSTRSFGVGNKGIYKKVKKLSGIYYIVVSIIITLVSHLIFEAWSRWRTLN